MIEQKKKLRLDELSVVSFVTNTNPNTRTIQGGVRTGEYDCDNSRDPCGLTIIENVSYENNAACMGGSTYCTDLQYEWCRAQESVPDCPTGLLICP